jgi:quercetin dioxygenase-like cupin family protein
MNKLHLCCRLLLASTVMVFPAMQVLAKDLVEVDKANCKVLLENDHVRVIDYTLKAGVKVAMHTHPSHVVYVLAGGKSRFTGADGKVVERETKAGDVLWSDATEHMTENLGSTDQHVLVIELKEAPKK